MDFWGCLAFAGFFLGDYNDWRWSHPFLRGCFPLSLLLLSVVTVMQCIRAPKALPLPVRLIGGACGLVFLGLLIYTLFFALPAKEAYAQQETGRKACTHGVYALCRHPGVLWFIGLYLSLGLCFGLPLRTTLLYSALNILLVLFEDRCVFPSQLQGYEAYRQTTPFLIPTPSSFRAWRRHSHQSW